MTKRGLFFIVLFALSLVTGLALGVREIFMVAFCLGLILAFSVASIFLAALALGRREIISGIATVRREDIIFSVELKGIFLLPAVGELDILPPGARTDEKKKMQSHVLSMMPGYYHKRFDFKLDCPHRGIWQTGLKKLRVHDIFGLFTLPPMRKGAVSLAIKPLTVFPILFEIKYEQNSPLADTGDSEACAVVADSGDTFSGTRQYQYGDPIKRIHWKQTVRTREVHIRKYESEVNPHTLIILDAATRGDNILDYADIATETVVALSSYYTHNDQSVRVMLVRVDSKELPDEIDHLATRQDGFGELHQTLATVPFKKNTEALDLKMLENCKLGTASTIHVVTDNPSDGLLGALQELATRDYFTYCIVPDTIGAKAQETMKLIPDSGNFTGISLANSDEIVSKLEGLL